MVKVSGITRRLKIVKTEDLLKQEFKGFDISTSDLGIVLVRKEDEEENILLVGISEF